MNDYFHLFNYDKHQFVQEYDDIDTTKTVFILENCFYKNREIIFPEDVYAIIILNSELYENITFPLKFYTKLTYLIILNSICQFNINELYFLGNLNYLTINAIINSIKIDILINNYNNIIEYFHHKVQPTLETNTYVSGFENIAISYYKDKNIYFLSDNHSKFTSCNRLNIKSQSSIEFLYNLYIKNKSNSIFMFEYKQNHGQNLKELTYYNPTKLPYSIIGNGRWFSTLSNCLSVDVRWNNEYKIDKDYLQYILHLLISKNVKKDVYIKYLNILIHHFPTYSHLCNYIFKHIQQIISHQHQSFEFHRWLKYCKYMFSDLDAKYKYSIIESLSHNDKIKMFMFPSSLLVDTFIISKIFSIQYEKYSNFFINIGSSHTHNLLKFLKYLNNDIENVHYFKKETSDISVCINYNLNDF